MGDTCERGGAPQTSGPTSRRRAYGYRTARPVTHGPGTAGSVGRAGGCRSATVRCTTIVDVSPEPDLEDARWQIRETVDGVAGATRLEFRRGEAHRRYPSSDAEDEPVAVIDDPVTIAEALGVVASADPSPRVVAHALGGLSLDFFADDGDFLGSVQMLSPRWVRSWWFYDARLPSTVLAGVVASLEGPPWDPRADAAIDAALSGAVLAPASQASWLAGAWDSRWPGQEPISYRLRSDARWVRFHSLPQSKRYPDDEHELEEVLTRHRTVLDELAATAGDEDRHVVVVTASWSASSQPIPRSAPVAAAIPGAQYWMSVRTEEDSAFRTWVWTHLYVDVVSLDDPGVEQLLRIVADDQTANALILAPDLSWLYAPYDGGADVYPATPEQRDELAAIHADWLSATDSGL